MRHFVLVYQRAQRRLLELHTFRKPQMADSYARNTRHLMRNEPDVEIDVVPGEDVSAVIASHPGYFDTPDRVLYRDGEA